MSLTVCSHGFLFPPSTANAFLKQPSKGPFRDAIIDPDANDLWRRPPTSLRGMVGNGMNILCVGHILLFALAATEEVGAVQPSEVAVADTSSESQMSELFDA